MSETVNEILTFLKKKRKTLTKNTHSGYHYKGEIHITLNYVEDVELWQVAKHQISGDVVWCLNEFWIDKDWNPITYRKDLPPCMWYFPEYIDKIVHKMTTPKNNSTITK